MSLPFVNPSGVNYELCIRDCSEAVEHKDGARFCRLYDARLNEETEPLEYCKVKLGLLFPRIHEDKKKSKGQPDWEPEEV